MNQEEIKTAERYSKIAYAIGIELENEINKTYNNKLSKIDNVRMAYSFILNICNIALSEFFDRMPSSKNDYDNSKYEVFVGKAAKMLIDIRKVMKEEDDDVVEH